MVMKLVKVLCCMLSGDEPTNHEATVPPSLPLALTLHKTQ